MSRRIGLEFLRWFFRIIGILWYENIMRGNQLHQSNLLSVCDLLYSWGISILPIDLFWVRWFCWVFLCFRLVVDKCVNRSVFKGTKHACFHCALPNWNYVLEVESLQVMLNPSDPGYIVEMNEIYTNQPVSGWHSYSAVISKHFKLNLFGSRYYSIWMLNKE